MAKSVKKTNTNRMTIISTRAKEIREKSPKKDWTDCVKAAAKALKKEGKI